MSIFYSLIQSAFYLFFANNRFLKKLVGHNGRLCVILTGPSLSGEEKEILDAVHEGTQVMCVNSFANNSFFSNVKPRYYCIYDRSYFTEDSELANKVAESIVNNVDWPMCILIPHFAKGSRFAELVNENLQVEIIYIRYYGFDNNDIVSRFFARKGLAHGRIYNVLVYALYLAIVMNYKRISIYGCSFDFYKSISSGGQREATRDGKPFYQVSRRRGLYRPSVCESLSMVVNAYEALYMTDDVAKSQGVIIENKTKGSVLDCFN
jgi:hypothetical protein